MSNDPQKKMSALQSIGTMPYRKLFETAKDGIVLLNGETGRISEANHAFTVLSGYDPDAIVTKPLWEIGPLEETDAGMVIFKELKTRDHIYYDDLPFVQRGGKRISVELVCTVHRVDDQKLVQCTFREITQRKELEEELWKSEARFKTLFRSAPVGIAFVDAEGRIIENNSSLDRMLGAGRDELLGRHFSSYSHPEDRAADNDLFQELLQGKRDSYRLAKRDLRLDGSTMWVLLSVTVVRSSNQNAQYIIRMSEDITERKQAEDTVIKSRDFYRTLLDELPNPIRLADTDGKCDYFNRSWLDFTGRRPDQEVGDGWRENIHPDDGERVRMLYESSLKEQRHFMVEYRLRHAVGVFRWVVESGNPYRGIDGRFAGYISSCLDIHERRALQDTLETISISDDLTGLLNRRGFFTLAQQQIKLASRTKRRLFLIYGDIDGLKKVNDILGHAAGDLMLVETASILREVFRESDIIARLGGDEFAVLLTEDSNTPDTAVILDRLRESILARNERAPGGPLISLSIGLQVYDPGNPTSFDRLISQADALMYEEKKVKKRL
jgi:diguanylate cyclase (GGDEF)-like protein/PAS domain S-box-containing protein